MSLGVLASYHFWRGSSVADVLDGWRPLVFADSGAFSAANADATIDIDRYAGWLDDNRDSIDLACTLDVIGDPKTTEKNTKILEAHDHVVVPVFHVGSPEKELVRLCKRYPYVALGGMVGHKTNQTALLRWLVHCLHVARDHDAVCHAFGITSMNSIAKLPLYSADSTTWRNGVKYGNVPLWDDMRGVVRIPPPRRAKETALLASYGFDATICNREYARREDGKSDDVFHAEYDQMRLAAVEAWGRFERWWHHRFTPISLDGQPDGPHIFIALAPTELRIAREVAQCPK